MLKISINDKILQRKGSDLMSLLNLPNPTETPEVRAYYEDIYRFGINNTFDESTKYMAFNIVKD